MDMIVHYRQVSDMKASIIVLFHGIRPETRVPVTRISLYRGQLTESPEYLLYRSPLFKVFKLIFMVNI